MNVSALLKAVFASPKTASPVVSKRESAPAQTFFSVLRTVARRMMHPAQKNALTPVLPTEAQPQTSRLNTNDKTESFREPNRQSAARKPVIHDFTLPIGQQTIPLAPQVFPPHLKPSIEVRGNSGRSHPIPVVLRDMHGGQMMQPVPLSVKAETAPAGNAPASRPAIPASPKMQSDAPVVAAPMKAVATTTRSSTAEHDVPFSATAPRAVDSQIQPLEQARVQPQPLIGPLSSGKPLTLERPANIFQQIQAFWQRHIKEPKLATPLARGPEQLTVSTSLPAARSSTLIADRPAAPTAPSARTESRTLPVLEKLVPLSSNREPLPQAVPSDRAVRPPKRVLVDSVAPPTVKSAPEPRRTVPRKESTPARATPQSQVPVDQTSNQKGRATSSRSPARKPLATLPAKETLRPQGTANPVAIPPPKTASTRIAPAQLGSTTPTQEVLKPQTSAVPIARAESTPHMTPVERPANLKGDPAEREPHATPAKQFEKPREDDIPRSPDIRLKAPETVANVPPRSFWGVKVVSEQKPASIERPLVSGVIELAAKVHYAEKVVASHAEQSRTLQTPELDSAKDGLVKSETTAIRESGPVQPESGAASQHRNEHNNEPQTQRDNDTPMLNSTAESPAKELPNLPPENALPSRMHFTLEQIRDLQAMVTRSLQTAHSISDGGREAIFNWNHESLGPLAFQIVTHNDEVEIRIHSSRQDVADALTEGRGTIERMIADVGLKIERFEVKVRPEAPTQDMANQTHERDNSERGSQAQNDVATGASMKLETESDDDMSLPQTASADRVWVA